MPGPLYCQPLIDYLEQHSIPCRIECSYKLTPNRLEQERFVFEIEREDISLERLVEFAKQFRAPDQYIKQLPQHYQSANAILFGAAPDGRGTIYKIYFEFWDHIVRSIQEAAHQSSTLQRPTPMPIHIGYKWYTDEQSPCVTDRYLCHPLLNMQEIIKKVSQHMQPIDSTENNLLFQKIKRLIQEASSRLNNDALIYTEMEANRENERDSFIINLNKADLKLSQAKDLLNDIHQAVTQNPDHLNLLNDLLSKQQDAWLGNIASGLDRNASPFFTAYFMHQ